jgi:PAS domain S-box-containing protein
MNVNRPDILGASILIVDDQPANVKLLTSMLRDAGYTRVESTMMPREVNALHTKNRYDLIVLDLQMPVMDGFEVMEALKASGIDRYLPVLVLTAQPGHKLRALQAGAKDFVSKPFDLVEVATRIHNLLEVRLLYKKLEAYSRELEATVLRRTEELRASEASYRRLTELASDWYWEQDEFGKITQGSGPAMEILGLRAAKLQTDNRGIPLEGWNEIERKALQETIAARQPFLDVDFSRVNADGSTQWFRVSGEPMFDPSSRYIGYRGIGAEIMNKH